MQRYQVLIEPSSNEVTQREFSKVIGVNASTVQEFKENDRLVLSYRAGRDKVKVKESIDKLNATMKFNGIFNDRQKNVVNKPIEALQQEVDGTQLDLEVRDAQTLFSNAKALREKAAAMQAAAEHDVYILTLVHRKYIEKILFERARQFRDQLLTSSKRMAPLIAGHDDITEVQKLLDDEYRMLLDSFSKLPIIER